MNFKSYSSCFRTSYKGFERLIDEGNSGNVKGFLIIYRSVLMILPWDLGFSMKRVLKEVLTSKYREIIN